MAGEAIRIDGLDQLKRELARLPAKIERRVVLGALMDGAEVVRREAAQRAPVDTGVLRAAIYKRRSKQRRNEVFVGVRRLSKRKVQKLRAARAAKAAAGKKVRGPNPSDAFYWYFQEFGYRRGNRQVPGRRFLTSAFRARSGDALDVIVRRVAQRMQREVLR